MEDVKTLPFGKKVSVGNFYFTKITRALSKKELRELRDAQGIPADVRKHLDRGGLPFIIVNTIGGGWSLSFVCGSVMYGYIEYAYSRDELDGLRNLFTMMYTDTSVLGDAEYLRDKAAALQSFITRQKVSKDENDDEALEGVKTQYDATESLREMVEEAKKEVEDDKQQ